MSWRIIRFKDHHSEDARDFDDAMAMAKEGLARVHELAEEMRDRYSERRDGGYYGDRYGMRGGYYGRRDHEDMWEDDMYGERRRRDSRGRYM